MQMPSILSCFRAVTFIVERSGSKPVCLPARLSQCKTIKLLSAVLLKYTLDNPKLRIRRQEAILDASSTETEQQIVMMQNTWLKLTSANKYAGVQRKATATSTQENEIHRPLCFFFKSQLQETKEIIPFLQRRNHLTLDENLQCLSNP